MAPGLCENCHQRQKFGTHRFCGKTCAAQAAAANTGQPARQSQAQPRAGPRNAGYQRAAPVAPKATPLCIQCGQNPKYNNFDYCGKSCAALANAARSKPPPPPRAPGPPATTTAKHKARTPNAVPNNNARSPAPAPAKAHKQPQNKVAVSQDDSTEDEEDEEDDDAVSTDLDAYPSDSGSEPEDAQVSAVASPPNAKSALRGVKPGGGMSKLSPGICAIPGCGQPSHVGRNGATTKYCSIKHREEAVKLELEEACIMCQRYPQSTSDYFCSSACRNQSMTKT